MTKALPESIESMIIARSTVELLVTMLNRKHEMQEFISMIQVSKMPYESLSKDIDHIHQIERVVSTLEIMLRDELELTHQDCILTASLRIRETWDHQVSQYDNDLQILAADRMQSSMERIARIILP